MINVLYVSRLDKDTCDRNGKPFTVTEASRRAGITRQGMHKVLNGEVMPKVDTAIRLARYISECLGYEVTVEDLWQVM